MKTTKRGFTRFAFFDFVIAIYGGIFLFLLDAALNFVIGTHYLKVGACASLRLRFSQRVDRLIVAPL